MLRSVHRGASLVARGAAPIVAAQCWKSRCDGDPSPQGAWNRATERGERCVTVIKSERKVPAVFGVILTGCPKTSDSWVARRRVFDSPRLHLRDQFEPPSRSWSSPRTAR